MFSKLIQFDVTFKRVFLQYTNKSYINLNLLLIFVTIY